jgi:hypothetical protein
MEQCALGSIEATPAARTGAISAVGCITAGRANEYFVTVVRRTRPHGRPGKHEQDSYGTDTAPGRCVSSYRPNAPDDVLVQQAEMVRSTNACTLIELMVGLSAC